MASRAGKILKWTGIGLGGLLLLLVVAVWILLSPSVLGRIIKAYAPDFIDGNVDFSYVSLDFFEDFPNPTLYAEDFSLTYPHERFAEYYGEGYTSACDAGRGGEIDTLVSSRKIKVTLDIRELLDGNIVIPNADGDGTRAFIHYYTLEKSNLDILDGPSSGPETPEPEKEETPEEATADEEGGGFRLLKARLTGRPYVAYTDISENDTLNIDVAAKAITLDGLLTFDKWAHIAVKLDAEDIRMGIKVPEDTIGLSADWLRFVPRESGDHLYALKTDVLYDSPSLGKYQLPLDWNGVIALSDPPDGFAFNLKEIHGTTANIAMDAFADLWFREDRIAMDVGVDVDDTPIQPLLELVEGLEEVGTDGTLSVWLTAKGDYIYDPEKYPDIDLRLNIPRSGITYPGLVKKGNMELAATIATDDKGAFNLDVDTMYVNVDGLHLKARGRCFDALSDDPRIAMNARVSSNLDSLLRFVPKEYGLSGSGYFSANARADFRLSHLDAINYPYADIDADIAVRNLKLNDSPDTIDVFIPTADIKVAAAGNKYDPSLRKGDRVLMLMANIDSLSLGMGESMFVRGSNLSVAAQNGALRRKGRFTPLMGFLKADRILYMDTDSMLVAVRGTKDSFRMEPDPLIPEDPKFTVKSDNDRIFLRQDVNRVGLRNVAFNVGASRHDSSADTLRRRPRPDRERPSWMTDEEFRKSDIDISLDESMAQYVRDWDIEGDLSVSRGSIVTPLFPLKNRVSSLKASFTTNEIDIQSFKVTAGESDLSLSGKLSGLRRSLTRKGLLALNLDITSDKIDADELLAAFDVGSRVDTEQFTASAANDNISDNEYLSMVVVDTLSSVDADLDMIVIPANIHADITLHGNELKYQDLNVDWLSADIVAKQRTVQITNGVATSNMGDIYFEGFYSTHSRDDIRGGVDINMIDITAEDIIGLVPAIGEMEPMLTNFKGKLDCELAAVSDMDTTMNFKLPTVNGVMAITGKDLSIEESKEFREIAKTLLFRDKKKGKVKKMSVSGLVKDNSMELFPFVLKIDRYSLALSGVQNFDESFKYHVSVLKSPVLIRFGINLFGDNFDNWKFKLTRARYRSSKVPVFTQQVNEAVGELRNTIHNVFETGSDRAVNGYDAEKYLARQGEGNDEELSEEEIRNIERLNAEESRTAEALDTLSSAEDITSALEDEQLITLDEDGNILTDENGEMVKKRCWLIRWFSKIFGLE